MCFAEWQCHFMSCYCKLKWAQERDWPVPSLPVRDGCDSAALLQGLDFFEWELCRGSETALLPEPDVEEPGPLPGVAPLDCGFWGCLHKPLSLGWVLLSGITALSSASSVPCCVHLEPAARSSFLWARWERGEEKQQLGENRLIVAGRCCAVHGQKLWNTNCCLKAWWESPAAAQPSVPGKQWVGASGAQPPARAGPTPALPGWMKIGVGWPRAGRVKLWMEKQICVLHHFWEGILPCCFLCLSKVWFVLSGAFY